MSNGRDRHAGAEHALDPAADPLWGLPGKRTLTDRVQRKAAGTTPPMLAPEAQHEPHNGLSCEQSFVDSILDGPVQRKADGEAATADIHALAAAGTAGSGGSLPFLDQIQASFGGHDVSGVEAHTDGAAAGAAAGMGATAFARGNHVAFGGAPDLHTAAHEAAHVVQQRAGVQLKGGVGSEGDRYEQHADAVADAVVRGDSAVGLLGGVSGAGGATAVQAKTPGPADKITSGADEHFDRDQRPKPPSKGPSGDDYIDNGARPRPDSFLEDGQRTRLISAFQQRALAAEGNYQDAAVQARVDKLLAKDDDDLPWIATMLMDLALGFVVGQIAKSLVNLRTSGTDSVQKLLSDAIEFQLPDPKLDWSQRAQSAFGRASDEHIKSAVAKAAEGGKSLGVASLNTSRNAEGKGNRVEAVSYLDQLKDAASIAYQHFREATPANASDAELLALYATMDVQFHLVSQYKAAITAKLQRYQESKVTKIGRQHEKRWWFTDDGKKVGHSDAPVLRDVWVRWQTYESGHAKELAFYSQDTHDEPSVISKEEPSESPAPRNRGFRRPMDEEKGISNDPKAKYLVPPEFYEVALMRHQQMWGMDALTVHIDDSTYHWDPARAIKAIQNKAARDAKQAPPAKPAAAPAGPQVPLPDVFKDVDPSTGQKRPAKPDVDDDVSAS